MIVHAPILKKDNGIVCISARFELQKPLPYLPLDLWNRFPEKSEPNFAPRADGFAATALLVVMFAGEDLIIRGPISPKLAYGLFDYRKIFHDWFPEIYRMIDIEYGQLEPPLGIALMFGSIFRCVYFHQALHPLRKSFLMDPML